MYHKHRYKYRYKWTDIDIDINGYIDDIDIYIYQTLNNNYSTRLY